MQKSFTCLFPVLAILLASASPGVSARAVAQPSPRKYCYQCKVERIDGEVYYACRPTQEGGDFGYLACSLVGGAKQCPTSTAPNGGPDCKVVLAMDGRGIAGCGAGIVAPSGRSGAVPAGAAGGARRQRAAGGRAARMHRRDHSTELLAGENRRIAFGPPACHDLRSSLRTCLPDSGARRRVVGRRS